MKGSLLEAPNTETRQVSQRQRCAGHAEAGQNPRRLQPAAWPPVFDMLFIRGNLAHTPQLGDVEVLQDRLLVVSDNGVIVAIAPGEQEEECLAQHGGNEADVLRLQVRRRDCRSYSFSHCTLCRHSAALHAACCRCLAWPGLACCNEAGPARPAQELHIPPFKCRSSSSSFLGSSTSTSTLPSMSTQEQRRTPTSCTGCQM